MKRLTAMLLCALTLLACAACGGKEEAVPEIAPQVSRMRSICELAVMECYYHNVAKYMEEDAAGIWLWKKDKHFWIEYSGVVELGVDASLVSMELQGDTVTITLPEARVLSCTVDSSSLTEDSFIVDKSSAKITAGDETAAFAQAQARMEEHAAGDRDLLGSGPRPCWRRTSGTSAPLSGGSIPCGGCRWKGRDRPFRRAGRPRRALRGPTNP